MTKATKPKSRTRAGGDPDGEIVSAVVLAGHLDVSRTFIPKLEADGVIHRQPGSGYRLAESRTNYIRHLRRARTQSPRTEAEAEFLRKRTMALEVRTMERLKTLVPVELLEESIDLITGLYRTELASLPARFTRDIRERRRLEDDIRAMLKRIANEAYRRSESVAAAEGNGRAESFGMEKADDDAD